MESALLLVYLAGFAYNLQQLLGVVSGFSAVAVGVGFIFSLIENKPDIRPKLFPYIKWIALGAILTVAMPSKEVLYAAAALKVSQEVVTTEIGQKAYRLLDQQLDEALGSEQ